MCGVVFSYINLLLLYVITLQFSIPSDGIEFLDTKIRTYVYVEHLRSLAVPTARMTARNTNKKRFITNVSRHNGVEQRTWS